VSEDESALISSEKTFPLPCAIASPRLDAHARHPIAFREEVLVDRSRAVP
jgi:hypothetical protein